MIGCYRNLNIFYISQRTYHLFILNVKINSENFNNQHWSKVFLDFVFKKKINKTFQISEPEFFLIYQRNYKKWISFTPSASFFSENIHKHAKIQFNVYFWAKFKKFLKGSNQKQPLLSLLKPRDKTESINYVGETDKLNKVT